MRMVIGLAALTTCIAAQPAAASEEPGFQGEMSAPTAGVHISPSTAAAPEFRLHANVAATAKPIDQDGQLRKRIGSSMFELYPTAATGFHLSAGLRLFSRQNFFAEAEKLTNGLLYAPRGMGNSALRTGFKRYTPAMTVGYTRMIEHDISLGVEAGSMLGRAYSRIPTGFQSSRFGNSSTGLNPVVNFVMGARF